MRRLLVAMILSAAGVAVGGSILAQTGGGYDLTWSTVDGGGATFSAGDGYRLDGTIGQSDAGGPQTADGYTLQGGLWDVTAQAVSSAELVPGLTTWAALLLVGFLIGAAYMKGKFGSKVAA